MSELKFKFKMPDDESLAEYISIKGEKGEKGDPTKLSQLENDTNFITASTDALTNYYDKTATDAKLDGKLDKATFNAYEIPTDFFTADETVSDTGSSVALTNTSAGMFKAIAFYGDMAQDGAPTPSAPVDIETVTGEQTITITGGGTQVYTINLGDIELCRLGNYKDSIFKRDGKWYKRSEVGKYTVTGNETFVWDATTPRLYLSQSTLAALGISCVYPASSSVVAAALSNNFTVKTFTQVYTNKQGGFAMSASGRNWQFSALDWSDEIDAKADIIGTIIYYALAEAQEAEITNPLLISQLEAIEKAKSYDGMTIITASGTLPAELYVEAFKNGWGGTVDGINAELDTKADKIDLAQRAYYCDSVAEMKQANLELGSCAVTTGYYSANDGGGALYKIRAVTNDDVIDESFLIEMGDPEDELVAELIIEENTVNIRQLGARSQSTDGTKYDIKDYVYKYITYITDKPNRCKLYIPAGVWSSTAMTITNPNGFDIFGDFGYSEFHFGSTIITTMSNNQTHLLNLGTNEGTYLKNFNLSNIIFSTYDWAYDTVNKAFKPDTKKVVTNQVMNMLYCIHGKLDNIMFNHCVGQCLKISACWENIYTYLTFRFVSNPLSSIMCFAGDNTYGQYASISSSDFQKMYFEKCHGNCIEVKAHASVTNNHFGVINLEPNEFDYDSAFTYTNIDAQDLPNDLKHYYIIALTESGSNMASNKIESIELNGMAQKYVVFDGNNYAYDSIIFTGDGYQYFNNVIGSIVSTSTHKDLVLFKNTKSNTQFNSGDSALDIQSVLIDSNYDFVFDVDGLFPVVHVGGEMKGKGAVTKIKSNLITFQECIQSCATNGVGNNCITSDAGALNDTKLCFRPWSYQSLIVGGTVVTAVNKIYIHAKLDETTTYELSLRNEDNSHGQALSIVGDGTWKWYEFDLNANMAVLGQKCWFRSQNGNNRNILLDCFFFA